MALNLYQVTSHFLIISRAQTCVERNVNTENSDQTHYTYRDKLTNWKPFKIDYSIYKHGSASALMHSNAADDLGRISTKICCFIAFIEQAIKSI